MARSFDFLDLEGFLFLNTVRPKMALRENFRWHYQEEKIRAVKTDVTMEVTRTYHSVVCLFVSLFCLFVHFYRVFYNNWLKSQVIVRNSFSPTFLTTDLKEIDKEVKKWRKKSKRRESGSMNFLINDNQVWFFGEIKTRREKEKRKKEWFGEKCWNLVSYQEIENNKNVKACQLSIVVTHYTGLP